MSRRGWVAASGLATLLGVAFLITRPGDDPGPVGPARLPAVDVAALGQSGRMVSSAWVGRPVLVNLWASWCGPCVDELPLLERFAADNPALRVVGVAVRDTSRRAVEFAGEAGVTYELGIDSGDSVARQFGLAGLPGTYLFGADGALLWSKAGQIDKSDLVAIRRLARVGGDALLRAGGFGGADRAPATLHRG